MNRDDYGKRLGINVRVFVIDSGSQDLLMGMKKHDTPSRSPNGQPVIDLHDVGDGRTFKPLHDFQLDELVSLLEVQPAASWQAAQNLPRLRDLLLKPLSFGGSRFTTTLGGDLVELRGFYGAILPSSYTLTITDRRESRTFSGDAVRGLYESVAVRRCLDR